MNDVRSDSDVSDEEATYFLLLSFGPYFDKIQYCVPNIKAVN